MVMVSCLEIVGRGFRKSSPGLSAEKAKATQAPKSPNTEHPEDSQWVPTSTSINGCASDEPLPIFMQRVSGTSQTHHDAPASWFQPASRHAESATGSTPVCSGSPEQQQAANSPGCAALDCKALGTATDAPLPISMPTKRKNPRSAG